ncbi:hypothetical protein THAOC_27848 [Thalassiosira oceanica]|uniref:Uncharacterized protein n=1 Tax=Thalassiosira oceanica TaxID=159749 RepID=K0RGJ1_THAOC|nr:hypothetical protein THAOC_27848 [Thalassiosira oceanica]|eukprot:EJK52843.1 hypothetical protein THAOC_27848 [Thalassiosira oceanica]
MGLSFATGALATSAGFVAQASRDDHERTAPTSQAGRQPLHELGRPQVAVTSRVGSAAVASRVGCVARGARPTSPRGRTPERQLLTPPPPPPPPPPPLAARGAARRWLALFDARASFTAGDRDTSPADSFPAKISIANTELVTILAPS